MGKLFYRIPGETPVEKIGEFIELRLNERSNFEGFVIAVDNGSRWFGFKEGHAVNVNHQMTRPFIVTKDVYIGQAHFFIENIASWGFGKAVLSRVKAVTKQEQPISSIFHSIEGFYPNAFCYGFESDLIGNWLAATPEVLVKQQQNKLSTMALAGTRRSDSTQPWEQKEFEEQGLVTAYIQAVLKEMEIEATVSPREELIAGPVKHLINRFECDFEQEKLHELVDLLHPTPAVSGLPLSEALHLIAKVEPHQRLFYSGVVGIQEKNTAHLYVNLRCAQKINDELFLYVGGGLTKDSNPEAEWEETENKALTLLNVF